MKVKIPYSDGRWHVTEPSGEVTWHCKTLTEAVERVNTLAASKASKRDAIESAGGGE